MVMLRLPDEFRSFRVLEASTGTRTLVWQVAKEPLIHHYFGKFPEETTLHHVKNLGYWLRIEKARLSVEARYIPRFRVWFAKAGKEFAENFRRTLSEERSLIMLEKQILEELPTLYRQMYADTFRACRTLIPEVVRLLRKASDDFAVLEPWDIPEYDAWMNRVSAQKVKDVAEATKRGIVRIVKDGLENDRTIDEIARALRESYGFSAFRAQVIARTEVVAASNATFFYGVNRNFNTNGATKTWLATKDKRTRPTHVIAGATQKQIPFGDEFVVGAGRGMFPGDSQLPAKEVIQCRCTALYYTAIV